MSRGARVTILEAYVVGEDNRKFHKIQLSGRHGRICPCLYNGSGNNTDT